MHTQTLEKWQHSHDFASIQEQGEKRTKQVLFLTATTMVLEITAGIAFGSMALLADGWHMGTHAAAFSITIFAYQYAARNAQNPQFTFGSGKVSVLGGFASAVALAVVALIMAIESVQRLFTPQEIHFNEAIGVAFFGLLINLFSAFLLRGHHGHHEHGHHHHHDHDAHHHDDDDDHDHHDHNLKAAYLHVLADMMTSLLAMIALLFAKYLGWNWLDPVIGIAGAGVITVWAVGLLKETSPILLDSTMEEGQKIEIKKTIEADSDNRISDLHLWKVGPEHCGSIISLVTHFPKQPEYYKSLLSHMKNLSHLTVEVYTCFDDPCIKNE
ncbi:MAG: CDF family Co(II)/Ni(II) efflux transporter DmeF [SAR324 cluster bacterium]|nr:CDF family Co(II)/Ni(II) efflux transporter DmeF [SAR324 cluster bacterium]